MCSIFSSLGNGMVKPKPSIAPSVFSISPTVVGTTTVIGNANYKVYTFTNTTSNYYTITKTDSIPTTIYYLCVGGGGSGFVGGGGAGQFKEGSISVTNSQTITLSIAPTTVAGTNGGSSTMAFSVNGALNVTSTGGTFGTSSLGGTSGNGFAGGATSSYGGGGGGSAGTGAAGSLGGFGGDGGLPKKPTVAGISAVYPNTYWAAGGPGGYVAGNSYAGAGAGTSGFASGKGIFLPGYTATITNNPNAGANTGSGGGSSNPANTGGSGIIILALPA
jgi:hypothetical protein